MKIPLSQLKPSVPARVVEIQHDSEGHWRKLSVLGILPGAQLVLVQRFPTFVVQVGYTMVALDAQLASLVLVEPTQPSSSSSASRKR